MVTVKKSANGLVDCYIISRSPHSVQGTHSLSLVPAITTLAGSPLKGVVHFFDVHPLSAFRTSPRLIRRYDLIVRGAPRGTVSSPHLRSGHGSIEVVYWPSARSTSPRSIRSPSPSVACFSLMLGPEVFSEVVLVLSDIATLSAVVEVLGFAVLL